MFESVIDMIITTYYCKLQQHKEEIETNEEFDKSSERKQMNELIQAIVVLWQNKNNRNL